MKIRIILLFVLTILFLTCVCLPASFAQNTSPENLVRIIYFLPNDRTPQPDINTKLDRQIKDVQLIFADLLEEHGFERKTFQFEADARGNAVVHRVNGRFAASHYYNSPEAAWAELPRQFDPSKNIYLFSVDIGVFDPVGDSVPPGPDGNPVGHGCWLTASTVNSAPFRLTTVGSGTFVSKSRRNVCVLLSMSSRSTNCSIVYVTPSYSIVSSSIEP